MIKKLEVMETKRKELVKIALRSIPEDIEEREAIAEEVISAFVMLTSPEIDYESVDLGYETTDSAPDSYGIITREEEVIVSRKPGNLKMNWKQFFGSVPGIIAAWALLPKVPLLLPFIALYTYNEVLDITRITLSERHGMALWSMWKHRGGRGEIAEDKAFRVTAECFMAYGLPRLTEGNFVPIIDDLCTMGCIELKDGVVWLMEPVDISYE